MTFSLKDRSTNQIHSQLNLLSTDDYERFLDSFMSLALTYSALRHKSSSFDISKSVSMIDGRNNCLDLFFIFRQKSNIDGNRSIKNILHQFIFSNSENYFVYILANVKNEKQVKYWSKVQRLLRCESNSVKVSHRLKKRERKLVVGFVYTENLMRKVARVDRDETIETSAGTSIGK